jgi:XTP/dITP diphosphohydrolase
VIIWLASANKHKKEEIAAIFSPCRVLLPVDAGIGAGNGGAFEPEESGVTFVENALIKARTLYGLLAVRRAENPKLPEGPVLADDSGLCVDALDGRPGVYSARYGSSGGVKPDAAERNALLLDEVNAALFRRGGPRSCRFVCAMVLLYSPERFYLAEETLEGELVGGMGEARGTGGFGYDPIVYLPEMGRTVAELSEEEKNAVSHRGKAGAALARLFPLANGMEMCPPSWYTGNNGSIVI